jgi:dihydrofolate synthase/folylpolyglutamate synthase
MPQNLADWLTLLEHRHPLAIDLGLNRCREVWQRMGSPVPAAEIFVVAGTNGKGSTVATICSLLSALGYRCGSYTTPHLVQYNERVQLNGQIVSDQDLLQAFETVERARGGVSLSYFEFGTLAAFSLMARSDIDCAVMEVGLGGRLDAVNLLDADCAVITPIGLDHQDYLGDDLVSIGREKAGIIRPRQDVVCGEKTPPESIVESARRNAARLRRLGIDFFIEAAGGGTRFRMGKHEFPVPLPVLDGPHQLNNMATAIAAVLVRHPEAAKKPEALFSGLQSVELRGRLERVREQPAIWIDVGHNPMAARAVASALMRIRENENIQRYRAVLAMLADKDAVLVVRELESVISAWYLAGIDGGRGQSGEALASRLVNTLEPGQYQVHQRVETALEAALSDSEKFDGILVFGSFATAADAMQSRILLESPDQAGKRVT